LRLHQPGCTQLFWKLCLRGHPRSAPIAFAAARMAAPTQSVVAQNGGHHRCGRRIGFVLSEVLDSGCGQPATISHAGPVVAMAAGATKVVATAASTAMTLGCPSATLNPMSTEAMRISPQA
jgi:hypothetical protein